MSDTKERPDHLKVRQLLDTEKVQSDLSYNTTNISSAMGQQSGLFVHYGAIAARASAQVDHFKLALEIAEARVYRKLRDDVATAGEKTTEEQLKKAVAVHDSIVKIKKALNESKQIESAAKTVVEAFRHRRDMLVQEGLLMREEMKGDVSIRERQLHEASGEASRQRVKEMLKNGGAQKDAA